MIESSRGYAVYMRSVCICLCAYARVICFIRAGWMNEYTAVGKRIADTVLGVAVITFHSTFCLRNDFCPASNLAKVW